jgi:uncharacterized membrane protein YkgB
MKTKTSNPTAHNTDPKGSNLLIRYSVWMAKQNMGHFIITAGLVAMLLWGGAYKMTMPGADSVVPLVSNSPLISWTFNLFGVYRGADIIGLTEQIAALLIIIGQFKPQIGIIGGTIAISMFFITSTLLISTPSALTITHVGGGSYLSLLGLFLFKDIISLGASINLVGKFGKKADLASRSDK